MDIKKSRLVGEIELFRFLLCIIIMILHSQYLLGTNIPFLSGSLAVEFFFLVSGYLMMANISKLSDTKLSLAKETMSFTWKKIHVIYPEILISFIIGFVFKSIARRYTIYQLGNLLSVSIFEILLIERMGLGGNAVNSAIWYIQSMLLCMFILYPLIRKHPKMMQKVVMPVIAMLLLGWLYQKYGSLLGPSVWTGFTYKGNIRAFAEICLGASCYQIVEALKNRTLNKATKIFITIVKWGCWIGIIAYMYFRYDDHRGDFVSLLATAVAVVLAFSGQGIDSPIYQNKVIFWLGKVSLPLYLSHIYFSRNLGYILPSDMSIGIKALIYFACSVVCAFVVSLSAKGLRALIIRIKNRPKKQEQ